MPAKKLSDPEITAQLSKTKGWSLVNSKLHREFTCKDFVTAFGNMTRVALVGGAAGSWNSFPSAAGGAAAQRIGARSLYAFHRRAANLSGGFDRRHHQVAHGGEFCGRAAQFCSQRAMLYQRVVRRAVSAV